MKKPKFNLFIADDDADDREFLREALIDGKVEVEMTEFVNGSFLFKYLSDHPNQLPDVIILDINMPIMNGYETLKRLKEWENSRLIPVIILTTSSNLSDEIMYLKLGSDHFFNKPTEFNGYTNLIKLIASYQSGENALSPKIIID